MCPTPCYLLPAPAWLSDYYRPPSNCVDSTWWRCSVDASLVLLAQLILFSSCLRSCLTKASKRTSGRWAHTHPQFLNHGRGHARHRPDRSPPSAHHHHHRHHRHHHHTHTHTHTHTQSRTRTRNHAMAPTPRGRPPLTIPRTADHCVRPSTQIYPCEVTPWTVIKKWYDEGTYVPYGDEELTQLLAEVRAVAG